MVIIYNNLQIVLRVHYLLEIF